MQEYLTKWLAVLPPVNPCLTPTKEENEFTFCITQVFQLVLHYFKQDYFPFVTLQNLAYYTALCTHNSLAIFIICLIKHKIIHAHCRKQRNIEKYDEEKITLMKKINIIHHSISGSILVYFLSNIY